MKNVEFYLHLKLSIGILGFVLAAILELIALATMYDVIIELPTISSFNEISRQSLSALVIAMLGAVLAIVTLKTDTEENSDTKDTGF